MKAVTLVLLWLVASAAAIGVAWSGVGVLDDELVAPAPAVINAGGEVGLVSESVGPFDDVVSPDDTDLVDDTEADNTEADNTEADNDVSSPTSSNRSTLAVAGDDLSPATSMSSTTTAPTVRGASTGASSSTNTTAAGSGSSSTAISSAGSDSEQYETRTFTLTGGATAIRFSPSATKVLWAAPNPGYEVRIEPESGGVNVEFRSDGHRSRIDAWWDNGPRHEIREED